MLRPSTLMLAVSRKCLRKLEHTRSYSFLVWRRAEWHFKGPDGNITVPFSTRLTVNTADVAIAAAVAGRGLTLVLSYMIAQEVASGKLKIVLADYENASLPVHVVGY